MQTLTKKIILFLAILITLSAIGLFFKYVSVTFSTIQVAKFFAVLITWTVYIGFAALVIVSAWEVASKWVDRIENQKAKKAGISIPEAKHDKGE